MAPGTHCLAAFFLLNEETESLIAQDKAAINFKRAIDYGFVVDPNNPDAAIAFRESVSSMHTTAGLRIAPTHYGSWRGTATDVGYQDIVISVKPA